jgi:hypothetical protein
MAVATVLAVVISVVHPQSVAAGTITTLSSTIPSNGDVNPYGVFLIPQTMGKLTRGNILISNFNNTKNLQGTGTTLVEISPAGAFTQFAQISRKHLPGPCPGEVGLTTALVVLRSGWVIVGSLPTSDGSSATAKAGCLLVLDSNGNVVETIADAEINGPWDMTVFDQTTNNGKTGQATLFVTNVLNGTLQAGGNVVHDGTVLRIVLNASTSMMPTVGSMTIIAKGFPERTDPAALVIGPTGVALNPGNTILYVADSLNNRIASISNPLTRTTSAGVGTTLSKGGHLNDPLGMTLSLDGNILTANGDDGFLVETSPAGVQLSATLLDSSGTPPGSGALFGLTFVPGLGTVYVDDATNTLNLFH